MEAKPSRFYEDFDPVCKWRRDEGRDTLEVHLPGFRREQIRVRVNHVGSVTISGERPLDGTRWKRFKKEVELPRFCNVNGIHANFMQSILTVVMPKKMPPVPQKEQEIRQISEDEHDEIQEEEEEVNRRRYEFRGWRIRELEGKHRRHEDDIDAAHDHHQHDHDRQHDLHHQHDHHHPHDDYRGHDDEFVEQYDSGLSPETTRDVTFKLMIVVIVILVIASYISDMFKSIMVHSFHF
ncbi:hypothetical protein L6164_009193 [Bauhinia variegata]|uniref:Uncharacterized protein n=1 Tax=Bauhinia variegata TaxID=167791 RepID=A0ACB9PPK7_BAUVA|nr:hypothetical protein L6164_009193 [Bauhinia variegata]